jgi:amphi-Trp domain-containing protein
MATSDPEKARGEAPHGGEDELARGTRQTIDGKIKFEAVMQRSEAVAYFSALVDGLRHGHLQFRRGKEDLSLAPSEQVAVEVKASKKGDKERVAFELEWKHSNADAGELHG